jgi:two-component system NtrC family response regulator
MKILMVEDDENLCAGILRNMRGTGWDIVTARNGREGLELLADDVDVLVSDIRMPEMDGMELFRRSRQAKPDLEVIIMTAYGSISSAIEAMKLGARAYLTKPFETEELMVHLRKVEELLRLRKAAARSGREGLVGCSTVMQRVYTEIDIGAASQAPILISGETGTGKELAARAVHDLSVRRRGPYVAVNLGAIPRELAEDELFGHEKGAFTGAHGRKKGRFALADQGTLFLDEINSLPLDIQPKLLRVIETKEVWPVGSERALHCDTRIIAATNADIESMVQRGEFREDLFYRLNVLRIAMPPLRKHPEDVPLIVNALLGRMNNAAGGCMVDVSAEALSQLISRNWPGNVRELANILERARAQVLARVSRGERQAQIMPQDLGLMSTTPENLSFKEGKARIAEEWSRVTIRNTLRATAGNVSQAARQLQMSRTALIRLMNRYGISRENES